MYNFLLYLNESVTSVKLYKILLHYIRLFLRSNLLAFEIGSAFGLTIMVCVLRGRLTILIDFISVRSSGHICFDYT